MNVGEWLKHTVKTLQTISGTAQLDAEILLSNQLQNTRAWILSHPEHKLSPDVLARLDERMKRRMEHEPIAYILGKQEFYGRDFIVNNSVLVPRPESETMIELALKHRHLIKAKYVPRIIDIGSGSGALGITLALEMNTASLDLIDIDKKTLAVAKENAMRCNIKARFYQTDLLTDISGPYDLVLANLPYVPDAHTINEAAMTEPSNAIFGGRDGLDLYRKLFDQLEACSWRPTLVCTESLPPQHNELLRIAQDAGFVLIDEQDFIQIFG
jgi:release factor glutamine methyltransferase